MSLTAVVALALGAPMMGAGPVGAPLAWAGLEAPLFMVYFLGLLLLATGALFLGVTVRIGHISFKSVERILAVAGFFSPFRNESRLLQAFPGLQRKGTELRGDHDGFEVVVDRELIELTFQKELPFSFDLAPFEKEQQSYFMFFKTRDSRFDNQFQLRLDDPAALAFFDADTRRRLLALRQITAAQTHLRFAACRTFWDWGRQALRVRHWRAKRVKGLPSHARFSSLPWIYDQMRAVAENWGDDRSLNQRLRDALLIEPIAAVRDELAGLWCSLADQGTPGDWNWPEQGPDAPFSLRYLYVRANPELFGAHQYETMIQHCPSSLKDAFLRDMGRFEEPEQIKIFEKGLRAAQGIPIAVSGLVALGGAQAVERLHALAEKALFEKFSEFKLFTLELLTALRECGPHPRSEEILVRAVRAGIEVTVCLDSMVAIGSPDAVSRLVPLRKLVGFEQREVLDEAILSLQLRHGLLVGEMGGALCLALPEGFEGALSQVDPVTDGGLSRVAPEDDPST